MAKSGEETQITGTVRHFRDAITDTRFVAWSDGPQAYKPTISQYRLDFAEFLQRIIISLCHARRV
jgi:hypothetical protein